MTIQRDGQAVVAAGALAGVELAARARRRALQRRIGTAQPAENRQAVGVLGIGIAENLIAQALHLLDQRIACHLVIRTVAGLHHQITKILQSTMSLAQLGLALGNHIALGTEHALVIFGTGDAGACTLGLCRRHGIVAGAQHALARRGLLHQVHQAALTRAQVVDGAVIHIGRANAVDAHACSPAVGG